ncbi:MAG: DUF1963 domain-containing protein [Candidatus Melainabacteria bacterium]|nr:DUF1963 domain-containing protein [Candidatus Melainabacteria bacterium]
MSAIENSILSGLNPEIRAQLEAALSDLTVTVPVLVYREVHQPLSRTASKISGMPGTDNLAWPNDKNGAPMVFWAQINLEDLNLNGQSSTPKNGILMLFVSIEYTLAPPKSQSWYKVLYYRNDELVEYSEENASIAQRIMSVAELVPDAVKQLRWNGDVDSLKAKIPALQSLSRSELDKVLSWLKETSSSADETLNGAQQICEFDSAQSRDVCIMAAFHANGITFNETRKVDVHYKHLVDAAEEWQVLWKLGGLAHVMPDEKRQLFICIQRQNLIDLDFSKCSAVFL